MNILNPEYVRIPWVLAPKKWYGEIYENLPFFTNFHFPLVNKIRRPAADSILMPPTFPIASLNRYTPNFSGEA